MDLCVEPNTPPVSWETFCNDYSRFSMALDGYVSGPPSFQPEGPRASFNHHEVVNRLCTRATCAQVLMAIRQGLFTSFQKDGEPLAHVYVNDCDEDVCTAWTLLRHHYFVESTMNPLFNRLVALEDALDTTAGAYPFPPHLPILEEMAWVFEPYRQFRTSGQLEKKHANAYKAVITDVEGRILRHVTGSGGKVPLDTRFNVIGGGKGWSMVEEIGGQARTGMFASGIKAFVSVRTRPEGKYTYTIGKMSQFVPLNLHALCSALNVEEKASSADQWGGADIIIGSPRVAGSQIRPDTIIRLMDEAISHVAG